MDFFVDCNRLKVCKFILTMVLLALWVPATVHCELESAGLVPMDECCQTEANNHRCDSGCNVVEDGGIKTECQMLAPAPPETGVILTNLSAIPVPDLPREKQPRPEAFKIHHLPQFVIHTALPIRGPSFAS